MEARDAALRSKHLDESSRRLPGPGYYKVLRWIHRILRPENYVEIGVHKGISLLQVVRDTPCIAVDPEPSIEQDVEQELERRLPDLKLYELTSDEFFARYDLNDLLGGEVGLSFIDGLHLFEQVLRDFINLERNSAGHTVILLHDCVPLDEVTASRERTTDFYCGDVWKATLAIRRLRPELEMAIVPTAPTGLCLVRGLDSASRLLEQELSDVVATYRELEFGYYLAHRQEMPEQISNAENAVKDWLTPGAAS
jgi:hypothetical protein